MDEQEIQDEDGLTAQDAPVGGEEIFRRVLRLYPLANPYDYFKNGRWQIDVLEVDLALLEAHRKEASAPDPTPLEDVKLPDDMPKENGAKRFWTPVPNNIQATPQNGAVTGARATSPTLAVRPAAPMPVKIKPVSTLYRPAVMAKAASSVPLANSMRSSPTSLATSASRSPYPKIATATLASRPASAGPAKAGFQVPKAVPRAMSIIMKSTDDELVQIEEFISTHGLVPVLAKITLAKLKAPRRRWVLANYDGSVTLEEFISSAPDTESQPLSQPKPSAKPVNFAPPTLRPLKRSALQSLSGVPAQNGKASPYRPLLGGPSKVAKLGSAPKAATFGSAPKFSSFVSRAAPKVGGPSLGSARAEKAEQPGSLIRSILEC